MAKEAVPRLVGLAALEADLPDLIRVELYMEELAAQMAATEELLIMAVRRMEQLVQDREQRPANGETHREPCMQEAEEVPLPETWIMAQALEDPAAVEREEHCQTAPVFPLQQELPIPAVEAVAERHTGPEPLTMERPADPGSVLSAGDIKRRSR